MRLRRVLLPDMIKEPIEFSSEMLQETCDVDRGIAFVLLLACADALLEFLERVNIIFSFLLVPVLLRLRRWSLSALIKVNERRLLSWMLLAQIYIHKVVELKVLPAAMHSSIPLSYNETIMLD